MFFRNKRLIFSARVDWLRPAGIFSMTIAMIDGASSGNIVSPC
jgi:hypothetical protein